MIFSEMDHLAVQQMQLLRKTQQKRRKEMLSLMTISTKEAARRNFSKKLKE